MASRSPRSDRTAQGSPAAGTPTMAPAAPMNGETLAKAVSNCSSSARLAPALPVTANQTPPFGEVMNTSGAAHGAGSDSRWWMNALPPGIVAVKLADVTLDTATAPLTAVSQLTMAAKNGTGLVPRRLAGTAGSLASTRWSTSTVSCPLASRSPRMDRTAHGSGAAVTPRMAPAAPMNGETLAKAVSNWRTSRDDAPPSAASAVSGASATVASTVHGGSPPSRPVVGSVS